MPRTIIALAALLAACTPAQQVSSTATAIRAAQTPMGSLFCSIQLAGGGAILANVIQAKTASLTGAAATVVALATNAAQADVNKTCADAAATAGGTSGQPVPPPIDLNTQIAQIAVAALVTPTATRP